MPARSPQHYMRIFEPLLLEECAAQLMRGQDEGRVIVSQPGVVAMCLAQPDGSATVRLTMEAETLGSFSENDLLLLSRDKPEVSKHEAGGGRQGGWGHWGLVLQRWRRHQLPGWGAGEATFRGMQEWVAHQQIKNNRSQLPCLPVGFLCWPWPCHVLPPSLACRNKTGPCVLLAAWLTELAPPPSASTCLP